MSSSDAEATHISVLLDEILEIVDPQPDEVLVDATLGLGAHSKALLERQPRLRLIGLDQDAAAVENASKTLESFADRLTVVQTNFVNIRTAVTDLGLDRVDAIIADLGVSSLQFDSATRGFSFRFDAPLDMRMDADSDHPTAADLLESLSEEEIANVIYRYGEERHSRRIARRIVQRREAGNPARTTKDLAELVEKAVPRKPNDKIHPATRTFQALRIAVNEELDVLGKFIEDAVDLLAPGGRLAIISFHSLEDRIVKQAFIRLSGRCQCPPRMPVCQCGAVKKIEILTKKPVIPTEREARENPRSRSAKLRAVRKPTADNPQN